MKIDGKIFDLRAGGIKKFNFIFQPLPMHTFITQIIEELIKDFFKEKFKTDELEDAY